MKTKKFLVEVPAMGYTVMHRFTKAVDEEAIKNTLTSANPDDMERLAFDRRDVKVTELVPKTNADCERAGRLYNTMYACGNDLTPENGLWFRNHLAACSSCREKLSPPL